MEEQGASLHISLHGMRDRELWNSDPMRLPLVRRRTTQAEIISIQRDISAPLLTQPMEQALDMLIELFDHFDWSPDMSQIRADQERFYIGRL